MLNQNRCHRHFNWENA